MILPASCRVFWPEQTDLSEIVGWVEANSAAITVGTMGIAKSILSAGEGLNPPKSESQREGRGN